MSHSIYDPILPDVSVERREKIQEEFGRCVVEQRNRIASLVRKWIETDSKFPIPIYDRLLDRVKKLDPSTRADIASISLLMSDQIVSAVLAIFAKGDEMHVNDKIVNYAIIAQLRDPGCDEVIDEVDVNRGKPVVAFWDEYKRWLNRFASSDVRPVASSGGGSAANE